MSDHVPVIVTVENINLSAVFKTDQLVTGLEFLLNQVPTKHEEIRQENPNRSNLNRS